MTSGARARLLHRRLAHPGRHFQQRGMILLEFAHRRFAMDNKSSGSSDGSFGQDAKEAMDEVLREKYPLSGKLDIHPDPGVILTFKDWLRVGGKIARRRWQRLTGKSGSSQ